MSTQTFRKSQSSDTKSLNIEKVLNEISGVVHRIMGDISLEDVQVWRKQEHNPAVQEFRAQAWMMWWQWPPNGVPL